MKELLKTFNDKLFDIKKELKEKFETLRKTITDS